MRVYRTLQGAAVFRVNKDTKVTMIELEVAGVKPVDKKYRYRYSKYFKILDEMEDNLGINKENRYISKNMTCYLRSKPVICRLYLTPDKKFAKYVVLASFQPGVISKLARELGEMGWKKMFLLEITTKRSHMIGRFR